MLEPESHHASATHNKWLGPATLLSPAILEASQEPCSRHHYGRYQSREALLQPSTQGIITPAPFAHATATRDSRGIASTGANRGPIHLGAVSRHTASFRLPLLHTQWLLWAIWLWCPSLVREPSSPALLALGHNSEETTTGNGQTQMGDHHWTINNQAGPNLPVASRWGAIQPWLHA